MLKHMHWKPNNWDPHSSESPITEKQTKNIWFWPLLDLLNKYYLVAWPKTSQYV